MSSVCWPSVTPSRMRTRCSLPSTFSHTWPKLSVGGSGAEERVECRGAALRRWRERLPRALASADPGRGRAVAPRFDHRLGNSAPRARMRSMNCSRSSGVMLAMRSSKFPRPRRPPPPRPVPVPEPGSASTRSPVPRAGGAADALASAGRCVAGASLLVARGSVARSRAAGCSRSRQVSAAPPVVAVRRAADPAWRFACPVLRRPRGRGHLRPSVAASGRAPRRSRSSDGTAAPRSARAARCSRRAISMLTLAVMPGLSFSSGFGTSMTVA